MNDILSLMLENTYTLPDLKHRLRILKEYLEGQIFGQEITSMLSPEDQTWLKSLSSDLLNQFNKNNISSTMENLEQQINELHPLVLYLSFEPDQNTIKAIGLWVRQNLSQKPILEIKYDPFLIGGCSLVRDGIYKDYSVKARIEEQKEVILTEFKKYIT